MIFILFTDLQCRKILPIPRGYYQTVSPHEGLQKQAHADLTNSGQRLALNQAFWY